MVDSGDLFFNPRSATQDPDAARVRADIIARAYARMGAAAVNIGEIDLLGGVDFLNKLGRHGIPLVSANVRHASDDRHVFDRYLVTEEAVEIAIVIGWHNADLAAYRLKDLPAGTGYELSCIREDPPKPVERAADAGERQVIPLIFVV